MYRRIGPWRLGRFMYFFFGALILLYAAVNCFYRLDFIPVNSWDEARHGVSAYEMLKSGDYLVNTYGGEPDIWNLKPPLSFWVISVFYRIFGATVFGMRFYAALSMFLTVLAVMLFAYKRYGKLESLLAGICLSGCAIFYYLHFARNGDADTLFTFFMTLCILAMTTLRGKPGNIWMCGLTFSLAFLTKSWHCITIVGVAGAVFFTARLYKAFRLRHWLSLSVSALAPIALWAILRFRRDGLVFLGEMIRYDLLARVSTPLDRHTGDFFFYFRVPFYNSSVAGMLALVLALYSFVLWLARKKSGPGAGEPPSRTPLAADIPVYLVWIAVPFIQFTAAQTKLSWYIFPAMVPVCILSGLLAARILRCRRTHAAVKGACAVLLAFALFTDAGKISRERTRYMPDHFQQFLSAVIPASAGSGAARGREAYLEVEAGPYSDMVGVQTNWTQNYLFLGETSMDFQCRNGGVDSFLSNPGGILITGRETFGADARLAGTPDRWEVVSETGRYVCLIERDPAAQR